jgi:hypothetical protein
MQSPPQWKGVCKLFFQYDVGQRVDLERCTTLVAGRPVPIQKDHRAPVWFQFNPPPLQMVVEGAPVQVGRYQSSPVVTAVVYDFGAVSVSYDLVFEGPLSELVELSCSLQEENRLWQESLNHVQRILEAIGPAVSKPHLAAATEDYVVFQIEPQDPSLELQELLRVHELELAQILRSERGALSSEEIAEAVASTVSYSPDDVALIDWQAALLVGKEWGDVRAVLEFASVQLLEMRFLDGKLDEALDRSYETLNARSRPWLFPARGLSLENLRVARMQVDAAIMFERVTNTLKLLGDQYLARVYQLASQQFRLPEWNATILHKLGTVDSIYQKLNDRAEAKRMEVLEWVIIILIAVSMLLPFLTGVAGH